MLPAEEIRVVLAESREQGLDFFAAWLKALRALDIADSAPLAVQAEVAETRAILREVRPYFQAAYENREPTNWEIEWSATWCRRRLDRLFSVELDQAA